MLRCGYGSRRAFDTHRPAAEKRFVRASFPHPRRPEVCTIRKPGGIGGVQVSSPLSVIRRTPLSHYYYSLDRLIYASRTISLPAVRTSPRSRRFGYRCVYVHVRVAYKLRLVPNFSPNYLFIFFLVLYIQRFILIVKRDFFLNFILGPIEIKQYLT